MRTYHTSSLLHFTAPALLDEAGRAADGCVSLCVQVFSDSEGSGEDDEEGGAASIAEEAIYRMVNALAAKTMVPIVTQAVPAWLLQEVRTGRAAA